MSVCDALIREAYGDEKVSAAQIEALQRDLRRKAREMRARDPALSDNDAVLAAADDFANRAELRALSEKRNRLLGMKAKLEALDTIRNVYGDNPAEGLKALLVGVQSGKKAARASAANESLTLHNQYFGGLLADVARVDGGLDILAGGTMDREIAEVLWRLDADGANTNGMDPRAIGIGTAIRKWQEAARFNANKAGAWIGKLPGWIVRQSHDATRIGADRDGWMAAMREHADLSRMMSDTGAESVDELLDSLWKGLASGIHLKSQPTEKVGKGLRGMARGLSTERVIHFKSADAWTAYNEAFGGGNLREAVLGGLQNMARATGLMRVLGPNHESTYDQIVTDLIAKLRDKDPAAAGKLKADADRYGKMYLAELDGSLDVPGSNVLADRSAAIRALQNMSALGGSVLSSVSDLGVMLVGAQFNGRNGFGMVADGLAGLFRGAPSVDRLELLGDLGVALESMSSKFSTNRFSVDDGVRGAMGTAQKAFFRWNLQNRWTDAMRSSIATFLSANLARKVGTSFDNLGELKGTLTLYGIDAGKWDIIRSTAGEEVDGQRFLSPSMLRDVPDEKFAGYLADGGHASGPRDVANLRDELERQLRGYFTDQNGYMLLTPDAATRGLMKLGTQKGTWIGEAVRHIMQFKSFALAFSQRVIAREAKQHGMMGVARMMFATTLFGYAAMSLKDMVKGKQPRDPRDWRTAISSMQQGGGLGFYGDVLFSQVLERRGQDAAIGLFGPTASDVLGSQGIMGIAARAAEGRDPSAAGLRFAQSNTPFINLFYTKPMLDYLIFWNAQEAVNPGSLQRMEREMQERTGQQFIISPSRDRFRGVEP